MAKPIQETIFKSRLTITYRTNISGTPQQERLPYRLLVLGEFSGKAMRADRLLPDLAKREVKSIKRATTVDDHLKETKPMWRIPANSSLKALQSSIPGKVTFTAVTCEVPRSVIDRDEGGSFKLSGTALFSSSKAENGLCDMKGELQVGGTLTVTTSGGTVTAQSADVIVSGAFASDYSEPASDKLAGVVTAFVEQSIPVKAGLSVEPSEDVQLSAGEEPKTRKFMLKLEPMALAVERTVPFPSIDAFSPDAITAAIPELRRLQVIKQLVVDLQAGLRNRPELRKLVKTLLPAYGASASEADTKLAPFVALKSWAEEAYPLLKLDRAAAKPTNGNPAVS